MSDDRDRYWMEYSVEATGWSTMVSGRTLDDGSRWEVIQRFPPRKWRPGEARAGDLECRVFWGSHGCCLVRGHDGPCMCECAWDKDNALVPRVTEDGCLNVGAPPYYGPDTTFFGEEVGK